MTVQYTANIKLNKPDSGHKPWDVEVQTFADLVDEAVSGFLEKTISGSVSMTIDDGATSEIRHRMIRFIGTLTGDSTITVPGIQKSWLMQNLTTGGFKLTITAGGVTAELLSNESAEIFCDGTDCFNFTLEAGVVEVHDHADAPGGGQLDAGVITTGTLPAGRIDDVAHAQRGGGDLHAAVTPSVDGFSSAADKTKLDAIEASATQDQTNGEIKTAYEANADTNEFSDAEQTKLAGIETAATADQTKADIDALNIDADTLDGKNPGSASGIATLDGSSKLVETLDAAKIVSGIFNEAHIPFEAPGPIGGTTPDTAVFASVETGDAGDRTAFKLKILDIGDWDMDGTLSKNVAHGLAIASIRLIEVLIRNDAATLLHALDRDLLRDGSADGSVETNFTNVVCTRVAGSLFDAAAWSTTPFNRGWVIILYV